MVRKDGESSEAIPSLNGFRAISVLIVVVSHAGYGEFVPGGLGVTTFFFLSGYLITTLMLGEYRATGRINILNFYARRCLRLYPPLLITIAIAYGLVATGLLAGGITLKGLLSQILYFANYYTIYFDTGNTIPEGTGVLWSLAVEEHFYIFYPLVMVFLLSRALPIRAIAIIMVGACFLVLIWRIYLVHFCGSAPQRTYYASDTRIDSIIYGCLLAVSLNPMHAIKFEKKMSSSQWALFAAAIGILFVTLIWRNAFFRETFRYSLQGIALLPVFYFAIRYHDNALFQHLNSSWITRSGIWSYSIYLIHSVMINFIAYNSQILSRFAPIVVLIALLISAAYAMMIDRWVDPYFRRLRKRFRPKSAAEGKPKPVALKLHDIKQLS